MNENKVRKKHIKGGERNEDELVIITPGSDLLFATHSLISVFNA